MIRIACGLMIVGLFVQEVAAQNTTNYGAAQLSRMTRRTSPSMFTSKQMSGDVINRSLPQGQFGGASNSLLSAARGSSATAPSVRQKSFAQVKQGPNTSPYMGMLSTNPLTSSTTNYFNNVRPMLEQQQREQQRSKDRSQAYSMQMQSKLQEAAAQGPYSPKGSEERAPTGHVATYMNNGGVYGNPGGYYPQVPMKSVRGQKQAR